MHSSVHNQQEQNSADDNSSRAIVPFVIVGHSMGGRIAMSVASQYLELVKALVIEDMDIRTRPMEMNIFQSNDEKQF